MVPVALRNLEEPLWLNGEKIDLFKDDLGVDEHIHFEDVLFGQSTCVTSVDERT